MGKRPSNDNRETNDNRMTIDAEFIAAKTSDIAKALGNEWSVVGEGSNTPQRNGKLQTTIPTGPAEIYLSFDARSRRVTVSGTWPKLDGRYMSPRDYGAIKHDEKAPEISVSADRSASEIAAEIKRRFLPRYLEILAYCHTYVAERDREAVVARENAERLAKAANVKLDTRRNDYAPREYTFRLWGPESTGSWWGDCKVNDIGATIELRRLTIDEAEAVLRLIVAKR